MQFAYLHGIMELLGIILEWGVHESYNEPLKVATQFRLQAFNQILLKPCITRLHKKPHRIFLLPSAVSIPMAYSNEAE